MEYMEYMEYMKYMEYLINKADKKLISLWFHLI